MQLNNPFDVTFGREPNSIISRADELEIVYKSFSNNESSQVYILTGVRGCGKTVAMTTIKEHYMNEKNWICIELNPENDMLEQLSSKLYDEGNLRKIFLKTDFNFSFNGFGFSIKGDNPIANISSLLNIEFSYLKKKNINVLISVDEAVSNNYMKVFVHEYQSLIREKFNVYLIMTGLYQNIQMLEKNKSLTFLYRAPKIYLSNLNLIAISSSYKKIFSIDDKTSIKLAKFTKGYAYAYQLLGNLLFESKKTNIDDEIIANFNDLIFERAYNIIYTELTNKEKEILKSAVNSPINIDIINDLQISKNQLSAYKKNLSFKGIIEANRDQIVFKLPNFKDFLEYISIFESID